MFENRNSSSLRQILRICVWKLVKCILDYSPIAIYRTTVQSKVEGLSRIIFIAGNDHLRSKCRWICCKITFVFNLCIHGLCGEMWKSCWKCWDEQQKRQAGNVWANECGENGKDVIGLPLMRSDSLEAREVGGMWLIFFSQSTFSFSFATNEHNDLINDSSSSSSLSSSLHPPDKDIIERCKHCEKTHLFDYSLSIRFIQVKERGFP